jgi:protoheme IX farnesyltransferase
VDARRSGAEVSLRPESATTTPLAVPSRLPIAPSDVIALAKPRITAMVLLTTAGGLWLGHAYGSPERPLSRLTVALALVGTALVVAGANALNMVLERDIDGRMARTRTRPLPAGRLAPKVGLVFGVVTSVLSLPILAFGVNATTALLAALANLLYVLAYTPLKQRSHWALQVGAVPGAIPPLLGWTAATGRIDWAGLALFAVLFFWQIPHFYAIALFRKQDYARAGLVVLPNVLGDDATRHALVRYTGVLFVTSLVLVPLGVAHGLYLACAAALGAVFLAVACMGLGKGATIRSARAAFGVSLVYLVGLFAALAADAALH